MPSQVLFKLAEDLITCFISQVVDFDETGVVIDSNRPLSKNPLYSLFVPPKFCTAFIFSWEHSKSQEIMETMLMENFGGTNRVLWYF